MKTIRRKKFQKPKTNTFSYALFTRFHEGSVGGHSRATIRKVVKSLLTRHGGKLKNSYATSYPHNERIIDVNDTLHSITIFLD